MVQRGRTHRAPAVGTTLLVGFLVATLVLASWLGLEAVGAARSHRQAAEEALTDYAGVAAWESSRLTAEALDRVLDEMFDEVPRYARTHELPGAHEVTHELDDAVRDAGCRCEGILHPTGVFRHVLDQPFETADVEPAGGLSVADVGAVVDELAARRSGDVEPGQGVFFHDLPDAGPRRAIFYGVTMNRGGGDRAVYAVVVTPETFSEMAGGWYRGRTLLPPGMLADTPRDSLLTVRVLAADGSVVSAASGAEPSSFVARTDLPPRLGGLVVEASVLPSAADRLVIGGLPRSRLPLLIALLMLTAGVGVAGLAELRRHQELARLREEFVSGVSHELRTPLTQIRMLAELLEEEKLASPEERLRSTRIIRREAQRLTMLVENILQFARSRSLTDAPTPPRAVDVEPVVREAVSLLEAVAAHDDVGITVRIDGAPLVVGEREGLRRIVGNLLDNALKYGPKGQTVTLSVAHHGDSVRIDVSDQGPGVPAEQRAEVWAPYRRLRRDVEARRPGSGVGLAVVHELVIGYGGRVDITDAPGGGARFVVDLPAAPGSNGAVPHA